MEELTKQTGSEKYSEEYKPVVLEENISDYWKDYEYWKTKEKLVIGREVKWSSWWWKFYASNWVKNPWIWQQTITWVWFKPKLIIIHWISVWTHCYWQYNAWNNSSYCHTIEWSSTNYYTNRFLRVNSWANSSRANLLSVNDDWFVLDWTTADLVTQFMYECFW
jgi:hypothetical protein